MEPSNRKNSLYKISFAVLLAAVTFIVFYNSLYNGFLLDDNEQILKNPWLEGFKHLTTIFSSDSYGFLEERLQAITYRPVVFAFYLVERSVFGLEPWGWHLFNVILHTINSVLAYLLLLLFAGVGRNGTGGGPGAYFPAFLGGVIFAVHPLKSEAAAWVGCAPELLYTLFCLGSFYLFASAWDRSKSAALKASLQGASVLLFFAALLSKETAIILPALLFTYVLVKGEGNSRIRRIKIKRIIPYIIAALFYLALRRYILGGLTPPQKIHPLGGFEHMLNAIPLFVKSLWMLVNPIGDYPAQLFNPVSSFFDAGVLISLAVLISGAGLIITFRRRLDPLFFLALAIIIIPLFPVLYYMTLNYFPYSDRYLYLPSLGFSLLVIIILKDRRGAGAWALAAVFSAASIVYAYNAAKRNVLWRDDLAFWNASLKGTQDNYIASFFIGYAYLKKGMTEEAVLKLKEAAGQNKNDPWKLLDTHRLLASAYQRLGRPEETASEYREVLKIMPGDLTANYNLAGFYRGRKSFDEAIDLYETALLYAKKPSQRGNIYANLGSCYAEKGLWDKAMASYVEALRVSPDDPVVIDNINMLKITRERSYNEGVRSSHQKK